MSRIGKGPINLPDGIEVSWQPPVMTVKGPKGELSAKLHSAVSFVEETEDGQRVLRAVLVDGHASEQAQWGTARALVANMVEGVSQGFSKTLEVVGVGYKVNIQKDKLIISAGFSHEVPFELPTGISASVENNTVTISGFDKQLVGQITSRIRKIRKPEPYKGKGIKYVGEVIRRKAGKTAKTGE